MGIIKVLQEIKPTLESYSINDLYNYRAKYQYLNPDVAIIHLMEDIIEDKILEQYKNILN